MPDNPISGQAGNTTRLRQLLSFFDSSASLEVTFVSLKDWGNWKMEDISAFNKVYPNIKLIILEKKYKNNFFAYFFLYKIPYLFKNNLIDISSYILRKNFREIADKGKFDHIIISYASWGKLIFNLKNKSHNIIDTHDFITAQKRDKTRIIGQSFQDEMQILSRFDEIWTYSIEEKYIFEQFTKAESILIPISFPINFPKDNSNKKFEVIYIASNNPHNISGITWFIKEVLPNLKVTKIHVIGKICAEIEDHPQIVKHGLVKDIDVFYKNSRIAICPMLTGTGVKIKVLEALSYGLPVVTNSRGVDGLINKTRNGCLVENDPVNFAKNMLKLLENDAFYTKTQKDAMQYFLENHKPELEEKILIKTFA